ncbi:oxalurate catabolism protein HpxZ [Paraburkholderia solisilvae]|uniref:DUF4440 domain-containing protein n=1 Tax=Paraburkholderia solisilvae TaxID=624376 RepID=A0A6J5DB83_9BURK|nr:oxalurate catabolism protein HpxZ [Paraburkholderia solisilvae]CAB3751539.1 hypothetical protein LMG29739_01313 [Paraburkholderia solisilvae]
MQLNLPHVVAEVSAAFAAYERALADHDNFMINALFWQRPETVRYGLADIQYGGEQIRAFRRTCPPVPKSRRLQHTVVSTFGTDFATVSTEFISMETDQVGRQMQTWAKVGPDSQPEAGLHGEWRIVAAHVSLIDKP